MRGSARVATLFGSLCFVGILCLTGVVVGGGTKSDSEVKVTAAASKIDPSRKQVVTITMVHNLDWHTYANPVGNDDFRANQTLVTINAKAKPQSIKIDYPAGKVHKDKDIGDYSIYEDKVEIKATVVRAEGDASPLEVSVRILACNNAKGVCLLPATVKFSLKD